MIATHYETEQQASLDDGLTTVSESWCVEPPKEANHCYRAAADYTLRMLGKGHGRKCLVVGSPVFEALRLQEAGWGVTYVDVRKPPTDELNFVQADASALPFADDYFDAMSSSCVLCHVGLGRYGDPIVPGGDHKAIRHFARVLKPGSKAVVMFGPCVLGMAKTLTLGRVHRVYSTNDMMGLAEGARLTPIDAVVWRRDKWLDMSEIDAIARADLQRSKFEYCYPSMLLHKGER